MELHSITLWKFCGMMKKKMKTENQLDVNDYNYKVDFQSVLKCQKLIIMPVTIDIKSVRWYIKYINIKK